MNACEGVEEQRRGRKFWGGGDRERESEELRRKTMIQRAHEEVGVASTKTLAGDCSSADVN